MSSLSTQRFDPTLRCPSRHPYYDEQCQMYGATWHTGLHRAMIQTGERTVSSCLWEDEETEIPASKPKPLPWTQRPRGAVFVIFVTVLLATAIILGAVWVASETAYWDLTEWIGGLNG